MSTEFATANGTGSIAARISTLADWSRVRFVGLLLRNISYPPDLVRARTVQWEERDDWIAISVGFGLNLRQIVEFSTAWPQPITTTQQVHDKITSLGLLPLFKKKHRIKSRFHEEQIRYAFTKLCGQAMYYGLDVRDILRNEIPFEGIRYKPDLGARIGFKWQFYVEVQVSRIQYTRWSMKFKQYVRMYEKMKKPYRVLFLVDRSGDVNTLRQRARDVLKEKHPNLDLFYFMTLDEFRFQTDILKGVVWQGAWTRDRVALIQ